MSEERGPLQGLFQLQRDVVRDPSKFKTLICGRRAGKTDAIIRELAHGMIAEPRSANLYIALTIGSALDIFWKPFRLLNEQLGWGFKLNESNHQIAHPNGSWLMVAGADNVKDLEKRRGTPWRRVRADECGAWKPSHLKYFVQEIIEPSFMDYDGDLWLAGTPGRAPVGYFYDACLGKNGFSVHRWTAADNPHVHWKQFVYAPKTGLLARRGWTEENIIFKREYLGLWSVDPSELVYAFDRTRCVISELPEHKHGYDFGVGFDFGVNNASAYSVVASPRVTGNTIYTVESARFVGMAPSDFADIANRVLRTYRPFRAVGDSGGLGKGFMAEYSKRYSDWNIDAANKQDRRGTLEIVSDMLGSGRKKVLGDKNRDLITEWSTLQWDEDRENTAEGQDNDVSDADMYISKEMPAFQQRAADPEGPPEDEYTRRERLRAQEQGHYLDVAD